MSDDSGRGHGHTAHVMCPFDLALSIWGQAEGQETGRVVLTTAFLRLDLSGPTLATNQNVVFKY